MNGCIVIENQDCEPTVSPFFYFACNMTQDKHTLTLYELNALVKETLHLSMPHPYWVEAEILDVREFNGHCYLELVQKDKRSNTPIAKASARCWRNKWMLLKPYFLQTTGQVFTSGLKVLLSVSVSFHESFGFAWVIEDIDPTYTLGEMQKRRQEILRILQEQGVDQLQKTFSLPLFAQRIAVISSEGAAGYGDFCKQLLHNELQLHFDVTLFPAVMQGEGVEKSVIQALDCIYEQCDQYDVVVLIRGGGATSDLSGFDTLPLAENVANFPLPIITGIGHDRDQSVLDIIAFHSVKTPTAAAVFLIDHLAQTYYRIDEWQDAIRHYMTTRMEREQARLEQMVQKIPLLCKLRCTLPEQRIAQLQSRMSLAVKEILADQKTKLDRLENGLPALAEKKMFVQKHRLQLLEEKTRMLDPMLLLKKGYSITLYQGKAVKNKAQVPTDGIVETKLYEGVLYTRVVDHECKD